MPADKDQIHLLATRKTIGLRGEDIDGVRHFISTRVGLRRGAPIRANQWVTIRHLYTFPPVFPQDPQVHKHMHQVSLKHVL